MRSIDIEARDILSAEEEEKRRTVNADAVDLANDFNAKAQVKVAERELPYEEAQQIALKAQLERAKEEVKLLKNRNQTGEVTRSERKVELIKQAIKGGIDISALNKGLIDIEAGGNVDPVTAQGV